MSLNVPNISNAAFISKLKCLEAVLRKVTPASHPKLKRLVIGQLLELGNLTLKTALKNSVTVINGLFLKEKFSASADKIQKLRLRFISKSKLQSQKPVNAARDSTKLPALGAKGKELIGNQSQYKAHVIAEELRKIELEQVAKLKATLQKYEILKKFILNAKPEEIEKASKLIIKYKINCNVPVEHGKVKEKIPLLHAAVIDTFEEQESKNNFKVARFLLMSGASIISVTEQTTSTPVEFTMRYPKLYGRAEVGLFLMENGAIFFNEDKIALLRAACYGAFDKEAVVNVKGNDILVEMADEDYDILIAVLEQLIHQGFNFNQRIFDENGESTTPLIYVLKNVRCEKVIKTLVFAGLVLEAAEGSIETIVRKVVKSPNNQMVTALTIAYKNAIDIREANFLWWFKEKCGPHINTLPSLVFQTIFDYFADLPQVMNQPDNHAKLFRICLSHTERPAEMLNDQSAIEKLMTEWLALLKAGRFNQAYEFLSKDAKVTFEGRKFQQRMAKRFPLLFAFDNYRFERGYRVKSGNKILNYILLEGYNSKARVEYTIVIENFKYLISKWIYVPNPRPDSVISISDISGKIKKLIADPKTFQL